MDRQETINALLDRYEALEFRGTLPSPPAQSAEGQNPSCGDHVTVYVESVEKHVTRARWSGAGCTLSVVGADVAAELCQGLNEAEILERGEDLVLDALGREVIRTRIACGTLGIRTLCTALVPSRDG